MIDRARLFACDLVAAHPTRQMTGERSDSGDTTLAVAVLQIRDHEGGSP